MINARVYWSDGAISEETFSNQEDFLQWKRGNYPEINSAVITGKAK